MTTKRQSYSTFAGRRAGVRPMSAFTLVELLTVVFIISLLIGILLPSINAARRQAKKATTGNLLRSIDVGMEMFKNDNEKSFRLTNGYPPSFSHPPIPGYNFKSFEGQFPFLEAKSESNPPVVYGAHWLPAMLMGVDAQGYVKRGSVPNKNNLRSEPWRWYSSDPLQAGADAKLLDREPLYLDAENVKTVATKRLPGRPPSAGSGFFPDFEDEDVETLPVIVDSFGYPVLYYAASARGRASNMVSDKHLQDNNYNGGVQEKGVPYYFHQDNVGFTGDKDNKGWAFVSSRVTHSIADSGALLDAPRLVASENFDTFARYIIDRKVYINLAGADAPKANATVTPVNKNSYLLISAGADGLYGTSDDVNNLPPWVEN